MSRPVIVAEDGSELNRRELVSLVGQYERLLAAQPADLVCIAGDRELGCVLAYLASESLGLTVAWFGPAALQPGSTLLDRFTPDVLVVPVGALLRIGELEGAVVVDAPTPDVRVIRLRRGGAQVRVRETRLLLATSGSTGQSKVARLSGTGLAVSATGIRDALGIDVTDRAVTSLPLYYCYGLSVLSSHLSAGATVVLTDRPVTSPSFWRAFVATGCTTLPTVPFHLRWLVASPRRAGALAAAGSVTTSGGSLDRDVAERVRMALAPGVRGLYEMYGQTETSSRISVLRPVEAAGRPGSVGRPIAGVDVRIENDGREVKDGVPGAIVCRGATVMLGYATCRDELDHPDALGGRLDTGDVGYVEDGYLYVTGRRSRFVKPLGVRVALDELERLMRPDGTAVAVGLEGESAVVVVEGRRSDDADRYRSALIRLGLTGEHLQIRHLATLPRTASGKPDYPRLAAGCSPTAREALAADGTPTKERQ